MIAALATLAFLATLWLFIVAGAAVLEQSGAKIAAALKGEFGLAAPAPAAYARIRVRSRLRQPLRARPQLRDAA